MKKPLPKLKSKKEFVGFFEQADLGEYLDSEDLSPAHIRLKKQDKQISLRLSSGLLDLIRRAARKQHTKYQRLIKVLIEDHIAQYL